MRRRSDDPPGFRGQSMKDRPHYIDSSPRPRSKFNLTGPGPGSPEGPTLEQCKQGLRILRAHAVPDADPGVERDLHELFGEWFPVEDGLQKLKDSIHPLGPVLTPEDVREWLVEWREEHDSVYARDVSLRTENRRKLIDRAKSRAEDGLSEEQIVEELLRFKAGGGEDPEQLDEIAAEIRQAVREAQKDKAKLQAVIDREVQESRRHTGKDRKRQPQRNSKEQWGKDIARALRKMDGSRSPPMGSMDECVKAAAAELLQGWVLLERARGDERLIRKAEEEYDRRKP